MNQNDTRSQGATITKPEAVWRAIEELGYQAEVTEILEYVRTKFGIDANTPSAGVSSEPISQPVESPPKPAVTTSTHEEPVRKPAAQRKPRKPHDSDE
jgi:hypothetical protein